MSAILSGERIVKTLQEEAIIAMTHPSPGDRRRRSSMETYSFILTHGPLTRYVKLLVAHAPGMPGMFSTPLTTKETAS